MDRVGAKAVVALFSMLMVASLCALAVVLSAGGWALPVAAMAVLVSQLFLYLVSEVEHPQLQMLLRYALGHLPDTPPTQAPPPSWGPGPSGPHPPPWGPGPPRPPPTWGTGMARPPPPPWGPGSAWPPPPPGPWGPGPPRPPPPPPRKPPSSPSFSSGSSPSFRIERPPVRAAPPPPRPIRGPLFARAPIQWTSSSSDASSSSSSRGRQPSVRAASPPASLGGSSPSTPPSASSPSRPGRAHLAGTGHRLPSGSPPSVRSTRVSPPPPPRAGARDVSAAQASVQEAAEPQVQQRRQLRRRNVIKGSLSA